MQRRLPPLFESDHQNMIHEQDEEELRGLLALAEGKPIPQYVLEVYEKVYKLRTRRYAGPMGLDLLVMVVMYAGNLPSTRTKHEKAMV
jgi:hypothetical protein